MSVFRSFSVALVLVGACGPVSDPSRTPLADKWLERARQSYKSGDFDDAMSAAESALRVAPQDPEIRTIAARMALTRLDFEEAIKLTEGLHTTEAHGIRGRAQWYLGRIDQAADELEAALSDPQLKDPWARDIARLARQGGSKHPFAMEGNVVAAVEMPPTGTALVVPCELEGEHILAMIATSSAECVLDSNSRKEPAWVDMRFGDAMRGAGIDVRNVPALVRDLGPLQRQLGGAPIKALLGVNLLRHTHATFDRRGDQFVVRLSDPPAPPAASRVPLFYVRGGGMLLRAKVAPNEGARATLFIDSAQAYPLALDDAIWKKAGVDPKSLAPEPTSKIRAGYVPQLTIGTFDLPRVPAYGFDPMITDSIPPLDVDLGGVIGAGLLSVFRVTFGDEGRFVWIEPDPTLLEGANTIQTSPRRPMPADDDPGATP
jgi:hypothetical protein